MAKTRETAPDEELVPVMVPRSILAQVYGFIASVSKDGGERQGARLHRGWTEELVVEAYRAASDRMRVLLDLMASRAGEPITAKELQEALGASSDVLNGVLGSFGRLTNQQFAQRLPKGENTWPFSVQKDTSGAGWLYVMPPSVARVIDSVER
jgi:hypothetical protein